MKKKSTQYLLGMTGACIVGFAVAILTKAGFGLDAFNSFIGNLVQLTGKSFGLFSLLIGICFVTINTIVNRKKINFFAIIITFTIGFSIDIFIPIVVTTNNISMISIRSLWFVLGIFIYGFGIALLINSNILSPLEEYMMALKKLFNTTVAKSKFYADASLMFFALVVGFFGLSSFGQIGIGTIIITVVIGKIIDVFLKIFKQLDSRKTKKLKYMTKVVENYEKGMI